MQSQKRYDDSYWPVNSSYADIVLNDHVADYWRSYIGQAGKPLQRFIDHFKEGHEVYTDTTALIHHMKRPRISVNELFTTLDLAWSRF